MGVVVLGEAKHLNRRLGYLADFSRAERRPEHKTSIHPAYIG